MDARNYGYLKELSHVNLGVPAGVDLAQHNMELILMDAFAAFLRKE
jgi:hypothetical protein